MRTLLIYTGGTIGMVQDENGEHLVPGGEECIIEFLEEQKLADDIDIVSTKTVIDSSNFGLNYYTELATIIKSKYDDYDAFLILMGTDTMAYVSSLLSYCIEGLSKPIVFTGGQFPLFINDSDSKQNLKKSILGIQKSQFPKEVGVYFYKKWHRAVCTTKIDSEGLNAYYSPEVTQLLNVKKLERFNIRTEVRGNIIVVKLIPFGNEDTLKLILESIPLDGIVLEIFGAGNMPDFSDELKAIFKNKIQKGLKVVVKSQCLKGGVFTGRYEASLQTTELNFINAGNMTLESVIAKMFFLFDCKLNSLEYQRFFESSIRGELY